MWDCILDGITDTLKLIPYLFLTFLLLEFLEHKLDQKNEDILRKNQKAGPFAGALLGALPQCGFSAMAASLFSSHVITMGTLLAIFLATSDEMLPIMIGEKTELSLILKIVGVKVLIGILIGFAADRIFHRNNNENQIHDLCEQDHCDCEENGILLSSLKHTGKISLFILAANLLINLLIYKIGEDPIKNLLMNGNIITYFAAGLVGFIPNCASSVILTELYLSHFISVGTLFAGLLTGSGLGILLLFRYNRNLKENMIITGILYCTGIVAGVLADLII